MAIISSCVQTFIDLNEISIGDIPPISPSNNQLWLCTKNNGTFLNNMLYKYNSSIDKWEISNDYTDEILEAIKDLNVTSRNLLSDTAVSKDLICTGIINQCGAKYSLVKAIDYTKHLRNNKLTYAFDWEYIGDNPSGTFVAQTAGPQWTQISKTITISADNYWGTCTNTITFTSENPFTEIGIRADNVIGTIKITHPRLMFGEKDLGWSQAPEDLEEKFTTIFNRTDKGIYMEHAGEGTTGLIDINNKAIKISAPSLFLEGYTTINEHFKVLTTGDIEGTNAKFNGTITSGGTISGTAISGGTVIGSTIQNAELNPTFKVTPTGAMTASNATIKGTISGSIISGETFTSANNKFKVLGNGTLEATEANITGAISAGSTITGSTVIGSTIQNAATNPTFIVSNTGNIKGAAIVGSSFQNSEISPTFKVDVNGRVDASNMNITGGSLNVGSNFSVSNAGILTAKSANFTGSINAGSTITGSVIQNAISNPTFKIDASGNITGGSININNAFNVNSAGKLVATGAEISGKVTIGSGSTVPTDYLSGTVSSSQLDKVITNDISTAKTNSSNAVNTANKATELATALSKGKMLNTDPNFRNGLNGLFIYNNSSNNVLTITKINKISGCPSTSDYCAEIKVVGDTTPGRGGFTFRTNARANAIFITRFIAKIPEGYTVNFGTNSLGNGNQTRWLTPTAGTGQWEEYIHYVKCGSDGTFSNTNYFNLTGGHTPTVESPLVWYLAYATVFDVTDNDERITTLDGKSEGWDTATKTVSDNKVNWSVAYKQIESWAEATPTGTTEFDGNKIKTGTIFANKMAIGDFTNICQVDENRNPIIISKILDTSTTEVITYTDNRKYFKFGHTSTPGYYGLILINDMQIIKSGDVFRFNCTGFSTSSAIKIVMRVTYTDNSYTDLGASGVSASSKIAPINAIIKINSDIDTTKTIKGIACFIHNNNTIGLTYLRSISINRMSTGELIVDGSITSSMIHTDGLDANTIKTGTLDANRIASESITANKIAIGDYTNYCTQPTNFTIASGANNGSPAYKISGATQMFLTSRMTYLKGGEQFLITGKVYGENTNTAQTNLNFQFIWRDANDNMITTATAPIAVPPSTTVDVNLTLNIPTRPQNATYGNIKILVGNAVETLTYYQPCIRLMYTGDLIVDGAITGNHIQAGSITTKSLVVGDMTNLVKDPSFENDVYSNKNGWDILENSYHSGKKCLRATTGVGPYGTFELSDKVSVRAGEKLYVEWYQWRTDSCTNTFNIDVIVYNNNGAVNVYDITGNIIPPATEPKGQWNKYSYVGTINVDGYVVVIAKNRVNSQNTGSILFDDILVKKMTTGELIVDGAVTADKIITGKLSASSGGSYFDLNNGSMMLGSTSNNNYLQWTGSSLNIKADSLSLKTGGTVATLNDIDGLKLNFSQSDGCNLIYNGDFKNGFTNWSNSGSNTIITNSSCPTTNISVRIAGTIGAMKQINQVVSNMNYTGQLTCSLWAFVSGTGTDGTTNKYIGYQCTITYTDGTKVYPGGQFDGAYDQWKRYTLVMTPPNGKRIQNVAVDLIGRDTTRIIYCSEVMLSKGNLEVPFSQNPNEMYDGIIDLNKTGITVTASNANTKTVMNADGFFLKKSNNTNLFKVDSTGLEMTGTVNATSGTIGGFNIDSTSLTGGNLGLTGPGTTGSDIAIWAGHIMPERAPLQIMHDGSVVSRDNTPGYVTSMKIQNGQFSVDGTDGDNNTIRTQLADFGVNAICVPTGTTNMRQVQIEHSEIRLSETVMTPFPSIKTHFLYQYDYDAKSGSLSVDGDAYVSNKIKSDTSFIKATNGDTTRDFSVGNFGGDDIYGSTQGVAYLGNCLIIYGSESFTNLTANEVKTATINFRVNFAKSPYISLTGNTSVPHIIDMGASSVSSTKFNLNFRRTNTTDTTIFWMAFGQRG